MPETEIPEVIKPSKLSRLKTKFEENKTAIVAATGFAAGIAATLWCIEIPKYNPDMPIPSLLMDEDSIKRRLGAGFLAAQYIDDQGWTEKYMTWAYQRIDDIAKELAAK